MHSFQNVFDNGMFPTECLESHWTVEECRAFFETQYRERVASFNESVMGITQQAEKRNSPPVFYSPPAPMQAAGIQDVITLKLASRHQTLDMADPSTYFSL